MPVPTQHDRDMAEIDDLHGVVMIRLRTLQHAGTRRPNPVSNGDQVSAA
jgi:hypothetical protein